MEIGTKKTISHKEETLNLALIKSYKQQQFNKCHSILFRNEMYIRCEVTNCHKTNSVNYKML